MLKTTRWIFVFSILPLFASFGSNSTGIIKSSDETILQAVWTAGERVDRTAVPALIGYLQNPNHVIRHYAVVALGKIQDERAIEPLIDLMLVDSCRIENTVTNELSKFGKTAVCKLVGRYEKLMSNVDSDSFYVPTPLSASVIEKILFREIYQKYTPPALLPLPDSESVVDCLPVHRHRMSRQSQKFIVNLAANSQGKSAIDQLLKLLSVSNFQVKDEICKSFISRRDKRVVPFLLKHENAGDSLLPSWKMLEVLTALPEMQCIDYFKKNITTHNCHLVATACIELGNPVLPIMEAWLDDTAIALKSCACQVVSKLACSKYKSRLLPLLDDTSTIIRTSVINGILECNDSTLSQLVYKSAPDTCNERIRYVVEEYRRNENKLILNTILKRLQTAVRGDTIDTLVLNELYNLILNEQTREFREWISGLQSVPDESKFREKCLPFLDVCLKSHIPGCRRKAFEIKSYLLPSNRNRSIEDSLSSSDSEIVLHALRSIADSKDTAIYSFPLALFSNANQMIRYFAAITASRSRSKVHIPFLLTLLNETKTTISKNEIRWVYISDSQIRFDLDMPNHNNGGSIGLYTVADAAAYALGCQKDKSTSKPLRNYLERSNLKSKPVGLSALRRIASDSDAVLFKKYLNNNQPSDTRELAMGCLFYLNGTAAQQIIREYIRRHADFAAIVGLKALCGKITNHELIDIGKRLISKFTDMNEKFNNYTMDGENSYWRKMPEDSITLYDCSSRLLIQSAIEMLSMGHPDGIRPSMKALGSYSYDCCASGETWSAALGRVPVYELKLTIDTLISQLKNTVNEQNLFLHYADVLMKQSSSYAIEKVRELLSDTDPGIRLTAAKILYFIADSSAIPVLESCLDDSMNILRALAFSTLYKLNSCKSLDNLKDDFFKTIDSFLGNTQHQTDITINESELTNEQLMRIKEWNFRRYFEILVYHNLKHSKVEHQPVTPEFHTRLFKLVLKRNWFAEQYLDFSRVKPDGTFKKMLYAEDVWQRINALKVYLKHPGTADQEQVVRLLSDENLEIQLMAGSYLLRSGERAFYTRVYDYIRYYYHRFPSRKYSNYYLPLVYELPLIELCTDSSALPMHRELLSSNRSELRFSSYKALLKMNDTRANSMLALPPFPGDTVYIKQFAEALATVRN